ncbi:MAG TPA: PfkB family carbohydrate kinase [Micromonosporaceae bacterium]|nr:PfkB family carbohydrate kinase [Micromonosporaceae bacterium]
MTGRVLVVGDLVTDVVAVPSGPLVEGTDTATAISLTGGGAGANTAAWLVHAGRAATLVAAVGTDPAGEQRVAELRSAGVECAVARYPGVTGTVVVIASRAERTMLCDRGANAMLRPRDVAAALRQATDAVHLHLSGYPLFDRRSRPAARHALTAARRAGLTTSVDAASAAPLRQVGGSVFLDWVRGTDLLFANRDEAAVLVGERTDTDLVREFARYAGAGVVKLGGYGAIWASGTGQAVSAPAASIQAVDVTGAGDAFAAGALAAWLAGQPPAEVLAAGNRLGADAVSRVGARPPER